jgi:hypothetical protein
MEYFMYSPLDMTAEEAFQDAVQWLSERDVVVVRSGHIEILPLTPNARLQALPGMYLVRVEPDGSLRTVHQNLD